MQKKIADRQYIFEYVKEAFGTEPEYLWKTAPSYAVLRHRSNRKWYAVVMDVPRERLGLSGEGCADIINVKCDPALIGSLRTNEGYLPAYHMNKDSWISVLLDGSVPAEEICGLIDLSRRLTGKK